MAVDDREWAFRNAELTIGRVNMDRRLGAGTTVPPAEVAEAQRLVAEGPALIAAARAEVARWRSHASGSDFVADDYSEAQLADLGAACRAAAATPATPQPLRTLAPEEPLGDEVTRSFAMRPEVGIDFYGNDIRMVEVGPRDVAACSARCDADGRCRAFSLYTPAPGDKGFCWLKHTVGERRPVAEVTSGLRTSPSAPAAQPAQPAQRAQTAANGTRCRAAAEAMAEGYHMSVTMADTMLAMGPANGASAQDLAGLRATRAEQQAKLDLAEAVIARYASAPAADAATRQALDRTPVGQIEAELARDCNGSTAAAAVAPTAALVAPPTVWEAPYMDALEPLYALHTAPPGTAFYSSLPRSAGNGRHEMWIVAVLRGVANDPGGAYDMGASLYSIDCNLRTFQVLRGRVYLNMAPARDTPIEPPVRPEANSVGGRFVGFACDTQPLPAFGGSLAQVRRAVPMS